MEKKYFYGHEVSQYGSEHGFVDYRTFAMAFSHILNNNIISELETKGFYFEFENLYPDRSEEIEEAQNELDELNEIDEPTEEENERIEELENIISELETEQETLKEIFQFYIIDDSGANLVRRIGDPLFYCEELDLFLWGVCHWGTSWDNCLTTIKC